MSRQPFFVTASQLIFKDIKFLGYWMSRWNQTHSKEERTKMLNEVTKLIKENPAYIAYEEVPWGNQNENNESLKNKFISVLDKAGAGFYGKKQILKMQH